MTDEEISKLANKLTKSLATKEDLHELKKDLREDFNRLESKVDEVDQKADKILEYADAIEETTADHEKRLKKLEDRKFI